MTERPPNLSVVIPTLGRPTLIRTVESLLAAGGAVELEILVAGVVSDPRVADALAELVRRHPQVHHLPVAFPAGDSSEKKNAGFRAARAPVVAFLDDDVVVAPDWPARIMEPFGDPKVGLVSGPALVPDDITQVGRLAGLALASRAAGYVAHRYRQGHDANRRIKWSHIIGCNMAYRRETFEAIGAFSPRFWPGEEMIAAHRAEATGCRLIFVPRAWVYHYPRQSLGRFWRQMHGYGATRIRLLRAGVEFEPATIVPALWVLSLLVLGAAAWFSAWARALLLLDLSLYALADLVITLHTLAETRRPSDALIFLLIPMMHLSYGLAEWREFFRPDRDLSEPPPAARPAS